MNLSLLTKLIMFFNLNKVGNWILYIRMKGVLSKRIQGSDCF